MQEFVMNKARMITIYSFNEMNSKINLYLDYNILAVNNIALTR